MKPKQEEIKAKLRDAAAEKRQAKVDKVTRMVAIAFVFVGVFYFFIKLLFL